MILQICGCPKLPTPSALNAPISGGFSTASNTELCQFFVVIQKKFLNKQSSGRLIQTP